MKTLRYVYWRDRGVWLGYLEGHPDYMTQGKTQKELRENLKEIYADLSSGKVPGVPR